jgi:hypothetical protein
MAVPIQKTRTLPVVPYTPTTAAVTKRRVRQWVASSTTFDTSARVTAAPAATATVAKSKKRMEN